ncbi:unnamed protein product, partial [Heterosigma akashiwo]
MEPSAQPGRKEPERDLNLEANSSQCQNHPQSSHARREKQPIKNLKDILPSSYRGSCYIRRTSTKSGEWAWN